MAVAGLELPKQRALPKLFDRGNVAGVVTVVGDYETCSIEHGSCTSVCRRVLGRSVFSGYHHRFARLSALLRMKPAEPSASDLSSAARSGNGRTVRRSGDREGGRQHAAGRRRSRLPAGRAVLAVPRSAGAADRRGARAAGSRRWPKPCSGRRAGRSRYRSSSRLSTVRISNGRWPGPRLGRAPRDRHAAEAPLPCPFLFEGCATAPQTCSRLSAASMQPTS